MSRAEDNAVRQYAWRVLGASLLLWALASCAERAPDAVQPIDFNHKAHVAAKVDCLQCHEGVLDPEAEPMPSFDVCAGCHKGEAPGKSVQKDKLIEILAMKERPHFTPLFRLADHVFFSHLRHNDVAELECKECHADMYERTSPPLYARTMSMDACIDCHKAKKEKPAAQRAVFDCAACHR